MASSTSSLFSDRIYQQLRTVLDPETQINIVDMGFIRQIKILSADESQDGRSKIYIVYTLTTPGCPLAGTIQISIKESVSQLFSEQKQALLSQEGWEDFDPERDMYTELSFDPPWALHDMSEEARAELGF